MTKREHIFNCLNSVSSFSTEDEKQYFSSLFSVIEQYAYQYFDLSPLSTNEIAIGCYSNKKYLTAGKFKNLYFDRFCKTQSSVPSFEKAEPFPVHYLVSGQYYIKNDSSVDAVSDINVYLRKYAKLFFENNCKIFTDSGEYTKGYDRQSELIRFDENEMLFINSNLRDWYIFSVIIKPNLNDFMDYLENRYVINSIFTILFSSIEKDKQTVILYSDTIETKIQKINSVFSSKYTVKTLSDQLSAYLTMWFNEGTNSPVFFCPIADRLKTTSRYVDRYFRNGITSNDDYAYFNGIKLNNYTNTYVIKDAKISLDMAYPTQSNLLDNYSYWSSINGYSTTGYVTIGSTSPNYQSYGSSKGSAGASYYGYAKPINATSSKTDGCEYIMTGSNSSIQTFCFHVMSSQNGNIYTKFSEFIYDMRKYKSMLKDKNGVALSSYLDSVYNIVKNM